MDDDDQAPSHFQVDSEQISAPPDNCGMPTNNLWFVLSPTSYDARPIFNRNVSFEFCPLCQGRHRVFYCGDCVSKGEFTHSNPRKPDHLTEKRIRFEKLDRRREQLIEEINQKIQSSNKSKLLSEKIKLTKQNIKYLKLVPA